MDVPPPPFYKLYGSGSSAAALPAPPPPRGEQDEYEHFGSAQRVSLRASDVTEVPRDDLRFALTEDGADLATPLADAARLAAEQRSALGALLRTAARAGDVADEALLASELHRLSAEVKSLQRNLNAVHAMAQVGAAKADVPRALTRTLEDGRRALERE